MTAFTKIEFVDLGLSVRWASCNIGASSPEDCGTYVSQLEYDNLNAESASQCKVPSREEWQELMRECTWRFTIQNGVKGELVVGPNGNSIFLPASGFRVNGDLIDHNFYGYYWTSTPYEEEGATPTYTKACFLDMCSYQFYCNWSLRRNGMTVRPVRNL